MTTSDLPPPWVVDPTRHCLVVYPEDKQCGKKPTLYLQKIFISCTSVLLLQILLAPGCGVALGSCYLQGLHFVPSATLERVDFPIFLRMGWGSNRRPVLNLVPVKPPAFAPAGWHRFFAKPQLVLVVEGHQPLE